MISYLKRKQQKIKVNHLIQFEMFKVREMSFQQLINPFVTLCSSMNPMPKIIILLLFLNVILHGSDLESDSETSTNLSDVLLEEEGKKYPDEYTLMLLDKSRVDWETIPGFAQDEPMWPFIAPHVREMENRELYFSHQAFDSSMKHYVCKLMKDWHAVRAEKLIDRLLGSDRSGDRDSFDVDQRDLSFSSAMILFPIHDMPDRMLAYLYGRWPSLLNVDTIVKNFGLQAAVVVDVFCDLADLHNTELRVINEMTYEDCRIDDPMNARLRSRRGLHLFNHFRLNAGDSKIEGIRFKPVSSWGRAYITASDSFQFRIKSFDPSPLITLHEKAFHIYRCFKQSTDERIYTPLLPYMDIPLSREIAEQLTQELIKNWPKYFKKREKGQTTEESDLDIIYPHWTYWFRALHALNKGEIYTFRGRSIIGREQVTLIFNNTPDRDIPLFNLIRSLPIRVKMGTQEKYCWFDRGDWFEISDTRIYAMQSELEKDKIDYDEQLLLPPYDEETILLNKKRPLPFSTEDALETDRDDDVDTLQKEEKEAHTVQAEKKDYEELAYNKAAFAYIAKRIENERSAWVSFMDRENVSLNGLHNKFEFADIVLKFQDHYYLIHVKRANSNGFGHVCTQAERCGMFLSSQFDRESLELAFMLAEIRNEPAFPVNSRSCFEKDTLCEWPTDFESSRYKAFLKSKLLPNNDALQVFIDSTDFDASFWFKHPKSLVQLLKRIDGKDLAIGIIKQIHDLAQSGIDKSSFFTAGNIVSTDKRRKITIVVAIIKDAPFNLSDQKGEPRINNVVRLHQTRQALSDKRLGFAWTTIPKKNDMPIKTLREYRYSSEDIDQLIKIRLELSPVHGHDYERSLKKLNIGTKKFPQFIDVIRLKRKASKGMFIIPTFNKDRIGVNVDTYFAKVLHQLVREDSVDLSSFVVFPYEAADFHWITLIMHFDPTRLVAITSSVTKELSKELLHFKEILATRKDFKDAMKKLYTQNKEMTLVYAPHCFLKHSYAHASGPLCVKTIEDFFFSPLFDKLLEKSVSDREIYDIKQEHWSLLKGKGENFHTEFDESKDGEIISYVEGEGITQSNAHMFDEKDDTPIYQWSQDDGSIVHFKEEVVSGEGGNCGFIALGTDRITAIQLLKQHTCREEIRSLIRPDLLARLIDPSDGTELPEIIKPLRNKFRDRHDALVQYIEAIRNQINIVLNREGDNQLTKEEVINHIQGQERIDYQSALCALETVSEEREAFVPSQEEVDAFLEDEFITHRRYVSYHHGGGGTLDALARVMEVGVTIFTGERALAVLLNVMPPHDSNKHFYLHHVGGTDTNGRMFLNHFNLFYRQSVEPISETVQQSTRVNSTDSTVFIELPMNRGNPRLDAANSNSKKSKRQASIYDFFPNKK